jgi:hypothetical protein
MTKGEFEGRAMSFWEDVYLATLTNPIFAATDVAVVADRALEAWRKRYVFVGPPLPTPTKKKAK